jgi:hypothetical protein
MYAKCYVTEDPVLSDESLVRKSHEPESHVRKSQ